MPWWETDPYGHNDPMPIEFHANAGPEGPALVRVWSSGKTDSGWGMPHFPDRYSKRYFSPAPVLAGVQRRQWAFAYVMRSLQMVCIDIDGKNGGVQGALALGMLPYTLAETSKSGSGYHLFYKTDDVWGPEGFAKYGDRIGIEQGVDIRGTGCVYHYPQQRWNHRSLAELPDHLKTRLLQKQATIEEQIKKIVVLLDAGGEDAVLVMQDSLEKDLAKPIPAGRRNTTLFAIGQQMHTIGVQNWADKLFDRGIQVGLDRTEMNKIISNITKYGVKP